MCTRTQEKGAVTPQDSPGLARECPAVPGRGVGRRWPAAGLGALSVAVHAWDLWKEIATILLPPPQFGHRANNREGTQPGPSTENWIKVY